MAPSTGSGHSGAGRTVLVLVAVMYVGIFPYHPKLRSPNELCRLLQTRALVEYRTLELNQALDAYGRVGDLSVMDGRYYPSKAPLLSVLAVPLYAALRVLGGSYRYAVHEIPLVYFARLFFTVLPTLLLLVFLRRFLRAYVSERIATAVVITYALGSLAFSYSELFMSHQATAVLLFFAFYALWRCSRGEWRERGYLLAGAFAGASVAAEYTSGLGLGGLVVYGLLVFHFEEGPRRARLVAMARAAGLTVLGALPFVLALGAYHQHCFGSPFTTGYKHLADSAYQGWHVGGILGIGLPQPRAFALSFFSPLRGLLVLSPFLALAGFGLLRPLRQSPGGRAYLGLVIALVVLYTYFTSSFSYDSWGWTTGPRHMTGLIPFLLLPIALFFQHRGPLVRSIGAGLCAASILVTGALTFVNYISDSVHNGLFGLALPLFADGYLPPTVLSFFGLPQPWAGLPALLGLLGFAGYVVFALTRSEDVPTSRAERLQRLALAAGTVAVFLGVLALFRAPEQDAHEVQFLEQAWVAPPGHAVRFGSNLGE